MEKYELEILGITYNQIESGVYAIILRQKGGTRRIPIIIGATEAQAIECKLQNIVTPRPLTHDLAVNIMRAFGMELREVMLKKLPNGVFGADLLISDGTRTLEIDSRSSDALALAVRFGAPIFTTLDVLRDAGFESTEKQPPHGDPDARPAHSNRPSADSELALRSTEELEKALQEAVEEEKYEIAAKIKEELDKRKGEK